jgi:quercetin dioxygenase-like cupin family protein
MTTPVRTVLTLLAGVIAGALGMALLAGTVTVTAESVRLATGFTSTHRHGGPTINLVRGGRVEIADRGGTRGYGRGDAFVEPGGRVHTITVADDAAIDVVRILPAGAAATTEVTDAAR